MLDFALELLYRGPQMTVQKMQLQDAPATDYVFASSATPTCVAILPFRRNADREVEYLLQNVVRPSWGLGRALASLTCGMSSRQVPVLDALGMLEPLTERPIVADDAYPLGTCFSDPNTDTSFHMFAVDLTNQPVQLRDNLRWVLSACSSKDPLVSAMVLRLQTLHGIR